MEKAMSYNISRMTIYALVCAVESDLRALLKLYLGDLDIVQESVDSTLMSKAIARFEKDTGVKFDGSNLDELFDYFDLGDTFQTINSNQKIFPQDDFQQVKSKTKAFEKLIPIRNRVMHIRPLDVEDLPFVVDLCEQLVREYPDNWLGIKETLHKIESDPGHVLTLKIRTYDDASSVFHNLPLPDFDETGLIGRDDIVKQVVKLCRGSFPVISIVGEGGVGKTALALKVAYELLEEKNLFDAVVWVTSKTTQISVSEIRDIKGAIATSIGVVNQISDQLIGSVSDNPLEEIFEYLSTFRVALFLDNLETILDQRIRDFVSELPTGSKLIITSRIGLGAYEYPVKLSGIEVTYASKLIRTLANVRSVSVLKRLDEQLLRKYAQRMHLSPGYIKWFVSAVQTGLSPETVLQNSDLFLEFCMSNVYKYLSADSRLLISIFQCENGWRDLAELAYLADFEAIRTQKALQELMSTNMLSENTVTFGSSVKPTYQIAELPKAYLNKYQAPPKVLREKIANARNKLKSQFDTYNLDGGSKYSKRNIVQRIKNDRVIIRRLLQALRYIEENRYESAYELLDEAKRLAPEYFEVHRVLAYFHQRKGNIPEARSSYELSISLSPNTPQLHFWYGWFLLRDEELSDEALNQFEIARKIDPESPEIVIEIARVNMFQKNYSKSWSVLNEFVEKYGLIERCSYHFLDMRFQLHYREADLFASQARYKESFSKLKSMRAEFRKMEAQFTDLSRVVHRIKKANPVISILMRNCEEINSDELREMQNWIQSFG